MKTKPEITKRIEAPDADDGLTPEQAARVMLKGEHSLNLMAFEAQKFLDAQASLTANSIFRVTLLRLCSRHLHGGPFSVITGPLKRYMTSSDM